MTNTINPDDRKALKVVIVEMTNALQRIDHEKAYIKDVVEAAEEKFDIKKKFLNKMARTMFNENYDDLQTETEHFEYLYEAVIVGDETITPN